MPGRSRGWPLVQSQCQHDMPSQHPWCPGQKQGSWNAEQNGFVKPSFILPSYTCRAFFKSNFVTFICNITIHYAVICRQSNLDVHVVSQVIYEKMKRKGWQDWTLWHTWSDPYLGYSCPSVYELVMVIQKIPYPVNDITFFKNDVCLLNNFSVRHPTNCLQKI